MLFGVHLLLLVVCCLCACRVLFVVCSAVVRCFSLLYVRVVCVVVRCLWCVVGCRLLSCVVICRSLVSVDVCCCVLVVCWLLWVVCVLFVVVRCCWLLFVVCSSLLLCLCFVVVV